MEIALIVPLAVYAFSMAISPGPNNTILLALAGSRGVRATLPYLGALAAGLAVMLAATGAGLGVVVTTFPLLYDVLTWVGLAYILFLAVRIALSRAPSPGQQPATSQSVLGFLLFQWVNPKGWIAVATYMTAYVPSDQGVTVVTLGALLFVVVTLPSAGGWVLAGGALSRVITKPRSHRIFSLTMATLLVASMVPVVLG